VEDYDISAHGILQQDETGHGRPVDTTGFGSAGIGDEDTIVGELQGEGSL
jgi:hypothetical protein